jgi:hypothetical protein
MGSRRNRSFENRLVHVLVLGVGAAVARPLSRRRSAANKRGVPSFEWTACCAQVCPASNCSGLKPRGGCGVAYDCRSLRYTQRHPQGQIWGCDSHTSGFAPASRFRRRTPPLRYPSSYACGSCSARDDSLDSDVATHRCCTRSRGLRGLASPAAVAFARRREPHRGPILNKPWAQRPTSRLRTSTYPTLRRGTASSDTCKRR